MRNENLNKHLVKGFKSNPQKNRLITPLFDWLIYCRELASNESLLELVYQLVKTAKPNDCFELEQKATQILHLQSKAYNLHRRVQKISLAPSTFMKELLEEFYTSNKEELAALSELCSIARLESFKKLVNYVFAAKKHEIPLNILISQAPNETDLDLWLGYALETIEAYTTQAFSYKILREGIYRKNEDFFARASAFNKLIKQHFATAHPKAINLLIASYAPIMQEEQENAQSRAFIQLLSNLFRHSELAVINDSLCQMAPAVLNTVLSHCLLGVNSPDSSHSEASGHLLSLLCQTYSEVDTEIIELIKTRLHQQDLSLLKDKKLIDLAKAILNSHAVDTRNGAWMLQLLVSPDFIAAASANLLQRLAERYRLILMTLKQTEFEHFPNWLHNKMAFTSHHQRCLIHLETTLAKKTTQKPQLLKKRENLLKFRAADSLWSIFNQLEENCTKKQQTDPQLAGKALAVLYSYYANCLTGLRPDLLFKIALFIISPLTKEQEAFKAIETDLVEWLEASKPPLIIYNSAGQRIGFIDETNYAMTFINELVCPLLDLPSVSVGMKFYDQKGFLLGTLTASGEVKQLSQQENIVVLLLSKLPIDYLEQSSAAIGLLINHLFTENALAKLYELCSVAKQEWLSAQVNARLINSDKLIETENFSAVVQYQSSHDLFNLLTNIRLTANAERLFTAILADSGKRQELFSEARQEAVFSFLRKHEVLSLIVNFFITQQDQRWLQDGLQLFVHFAQSANQSDLMFRALDALKAHNDLPEERLDRLLTTLLSSEACATIIWRFVLKSSSLDSLQQVNQERAERLASFFFKKHCIAAISILNKENNWILCSYQYRLVLLILAKQYERLFCTGATQLWSNEELKQMSIFIKKHFAQRANPDKNFTLGKELLEELVFRCSNFGQTDLFYRGGEFDPAVSLLKFERDRSKRLVVNAPPTIKVSLLSAFLINYTGSRQRLEQLINDYINDKRIQAKSEHLHSISLVMAKLPLRDFSVCVFNKLEEFVTENPASLDRKLLADMAEFYSFRTHRNPLESPNAELQLLRHFGQQKKYELIVQSCDLLESEVADSDCSSLLREITTQAKMESKLCKHLSKWYFPIYQFIARLWNYETAEQNNTRLYVPPCNGKSNYSSPIKTPEAIKTPSQEIKLTGNRHCLKTRYQRFLESHSSATQLSSITKGPSFFKPATASSPNASEQEKIASAGSQFNLMS